MSKRIRVDCLIAVATAIAIGFAERGTVPAAGAGDFWDSNGPGHPEKSPRKYESPSVERPLVADAKGRTGFIRDWIVLGAFPDPGGRTVWQEPVTPELLKREVNFHKDMLAKAGGEKEVQPWLGEKVVGAGRPTARLAIHRGRRQERKCRPGRALQARHTRPRSTCSATWPVT